MSLFRSYFTHIVLLFAVVGSAPAFAQTEVSRTEYKLHRQLDKHFDKFAGFMEDDLEQYDYLMYRLSFTDKVDAVRSHVVRDYENYLKEWSDRNEEKDQKRVNELLVEFANEKSTKEGQLKLINRYRELLSEDLVLVLDAFYRQMILEIEAHGNYELANVMMESKKSIKSSDVRAALNEFFSNDHIDETHNILHDRVVQVGGSKAMKDSIRQEKRKNKKWGCVAAKVLAGVAVAPLTALTLESAILAAPILVGNLTWFTAGAAATSVGSAIGFRASLRQLLTGCHREKHTFENIDGFAIQPTESK